MKIISFAGVDGSGKSTQTELLTTYLESLGQRVVYFHATEFSLANRLARKRKKKEELFIPGNEPAVTHSSFSGALLRLIFLAIDSLRFETYSRHLKKGGVTILITDRFFQDSLLNIAYLSRNPFIRLGVKFLSNVVPTPEEQFYLMLEVEDIIKRERVPEQGTTYLEQKIVLYNRPPFHWFPAIINANQSPGAVHLEVVSRLQNI